MKLKLVNSITFLLYLFFLPSIVKADISDKDFFSFFAIYFLFLYIPTIIATIASIVVLKMNKANPKTATVVNFIILIINSILGLGLAIGSLRIGLGLPFLVFLIYILPTGIVFVITYIKWSNSRKIENLDAY